MAGRVTQIEIDLMRLAAQFGSVLSQRLRSGYLVGIFGVRIGSSLHLLASAQAGI
jgi:hypothetical protein